jgi:hypothetical protein
MGRSTAFAVGVVALVLATPAVAALYVCHPDPAGTRALQLHGQVAGYAVHGSTATIALRDGGACTTVTWAAAATRRRASCSLPRPSFSPMHGVRIVRPSPGADLPDRLVVPGGRSWPLPVRVRAATLQVAGDLAAYEALGGHGLWVTRLSDGRTTFVAPVREGRAVLNADGAFYIDNVFKNASSLRPVAKFVPTSALASELAQVGAPVHTNGAIRAFSMDGTRMALVVAGSCDGVYLWSIPWRSFHRVSQEAGVTCGALGASGKISQVALGGSRAQWVTTQSGRPVVVATDDIACEEWVVGRLHGVGRPALAGDGPMLAFALAGHVATILENYRTETMYGLHGVHALAADGATTAALTRQLVTIHDARARERAFRAAGAQSLAIRRGTVVTTTAGGRLDVYRAGRLVHSWPLPAGTRPGVDLQYGIAAVATHNGVYAIDVANGRTALLASTPTPASAQIEPVGVGYAYSIGSRGTAAIVPMTAVEAALGR